MKTILAISCALALAPLSAFAGDKPASIFIVEKQTGTVPAINEKS